MNVHHVGYVVKDLTETAGTFATLGYRQCSEVIHDEARRVDICFVQNGAYCVELVAPWDEASVCWNILKSGGGVRPYHICYEADDFDVQSMGFQQKGWILTAPPMSAPAIGNKRVAFFYHKNGGLIEIVEKGNNDGYIEND